MGTNGNDLFKQEGYNLMAAAFEVYNEKGSGFLEEVYHEGLEREWRDAASRGGRSPHF